MRGSSFGAPVRTSLLPGLAYGREGLGEAIGAKLVSAQAAQGRVASRGDRIVETELRVVDGVPVGNRAARRAGARALRRSANS